MSLDKDAVEGETVAQASSAQVRKSIAPGLRRLGIKVKLKVRNLGVDFAAGQGVGKKGRAVHSSRLKEGIRRIRRVSGVGAGARRQVIRSMVIPSVTFGSAAQAMPKKSITLLRTEMAKTFGQIEGKSVTARLLMEEADPMLRVIDKAVMTWVCAVWDRLIGQDDLREAWRVAIVDKMGEKKKGAPKQGGLQRSGKDLKSLDGQHRTTMCSERETVCCWRLDTAKLRKVLSRSTQH